MTTTSYVPEFCTSEQIDAGVTALLKHLGVQAPEELTMKSIEVRDGRVMLEILPNNKNGGAIAIASDAPVLWAEIRLRPF